MKATSRKRLLISSVAMLLVAMLALGTATFAWFTSNPNANAEGLRLKTTASAGLVVRTDSDAVWSHEADFYKNQPTGAFNLTPASMEQNVTEGTNTTAKKFWTVLAHDADEYGHSTAAADAMTEATVTTWDSTNSVFTNADVYAESVYFRLSDGSDASDATTAAKKVYIKGVTINTHNGADMNGCIRVAITTLDGKEILGTFAQATNSSPNGTLTTANKTAGTFNPAIKEVSNLGAFTGGNIDTGATALSADESDVSKGVKVFVYLDGQDTNCFSDMVKTVNAQQIIDSIQVDFTLA